MPESLSSETLHSGVSYHINAGQRVAYRFATAADIDAYYGTRPPQTLRAVVLTLDDTPTAVIGLAQEGEFAKLFSEYKLEFRPYIRSMAVYRAIKAAMQMVAQSKLPVVAVSHPDEPESPRLLRRLGFEFYESSEFGDLYEWRPSSGPRRSRELKA